MDWMALGVSLRLAGLSSFCLLIVGFPLACWLAFGRSRWRRLVEALVALPLVLPPTVLGFYLVLAWNENALPGFLWRLGLGRPLLFSFEALLLASIVSSLPFAVAPFVTGLRAIDLRLVEAAQGLGATPARVLLSVVLPLAWPGVVAGLGVSAAHAMGEFGVVLMVGGNIPGQTRTLSIAIYDAVQALDYAQAHRMALVSAAIGLASLLALRALRVRGPN